MDHTPPAGPSDIFSGGGQAAALMRALDWSKTPLGRVAGWPQSLRTTVSTCINSRFPILVWWGPELVMLYNDAYIPIVGGKHPVSLGQPGRECWPEIWVIIGPMLEGVLAHGTATWSENQYLPLQRHGFAEECYFTFSYSPIRDESGGVGGVFTAVAETTAQVLAARRLTTLRDVGASTAGTSTVADACARVMAAVSRNASDAPFALLYIVDDDRNTAKLAAPAGVDADAIVGIELVALGVGRSDSELSDAFANVLQKHVSSHLVRLPHDLSSIQAHDATLRAASALVLDVERPGETSSSGLLVVGLSPQLQLDESYISFLELLAGSVATSLNGARAYEEETRRARRLAELDQAKTAFFSNVSHEFRTPLTLMLGPLEDCLSDEREPPSDGQRHRLQLVRRNGLRLQKLVNTLLDFARIEAHRAQVDFVPTDLAALTRDLASSFESVMSSAGIRFVVDCQRTGDGFQVDPEMWEKIVLNLLSNAFKYTFQGEVRVELRAVDTGAELCVRDTGVGIPEPELDRVFERFHRVEGVHGRSHEGTGIGLSLVRELVRLHGGEVTATSKLGAGSAFTVTIPRRPPGHTPRRQSRTLTETGIGPSAFLAEIQQWNVRDVDSLLTSQPASSRPSVPVPRSGARILVADDNADMRSYLTRLLSPHWEVATARDGIEALSMAGEHPPDVLISDVMMPGMDGLQLASALRSDERTATIPVLLLSARAGEQATVEGLASGADDYLVKPFSANELLARVNAQLTISRLRQERVTAEKERAKDAQQRLADAHQATRAREHMLSVVSHDLRAPLGTITTAIELITRLPRHPGEDARLLKYTGTIRRSTDRMQRMLADLLDLASIDAGTLSLHCEEYPLAGLVNDMRETFQGPAVAKKLSLVFAIELDLPPMVFDLARLGQVLANLISNALTFTNEGGSVTLSIGRTGDSVAFAVEDTGIGIAAESLPHIFDRFWHNDRPGRHGHGLGLSIARGIVASHGGTLRVKSELGRGTRFYFELPIERAGSSVAVSPREPEDSSNFLAGGGQMGKLLRSMDWSQSPLGPIAGWPQSLRAIVSLCLASTFPISIVWGQSHVQIYNDGYWPICGGKHPQSMGQAFTDCWASAWPAIGEAFEKALAGEAQFLENQRMFLDRRGYLEETFFTFSFSPIRDDRGGVGGLFHPVIETTLLMLSERRTRALRDLADRTGKADDVNAVYAGAIAALREYAFDVPFVLVYAIDPALPRASLLGCSGIEPGSLAAPKEIELDSGLRPWPLSTLVSSPTTLRVDDVNERLAAQPCGPYAELPKTALLIPSGMSPGARPAVVMVMGASARLPFNDNYRDFFELIAVTVASALAAARSHEDERRRSEALAELDRTKTAFFSNVSHEFRTPLTLILGPIEDALASSTKVLAGPELEAVRRNALRLYKLVNSLLDFSRMEAGRAKATFVPTDLAEFTADIASGFRSAVEAAGLRLRVEVSRLPEPVYVDPGMWEKIVLNLLSNALKYTYHGEIAVRVEWLETGAVLRVRDTGIGIAIDELERIFERFYRAPTSRGRSHEGAGIGLSLIDELVRQHAGKVKVESEVGVGSEFTVYIPRGTGHLDPERIDRTPRPRSSAASAALFLEEALQWSLPEVARQSAAGADSRGMTEARILVADDNADLRTYVSGLLQSKFTSVTTACDGREALAAARADCPDLLISDVMMPELDGFGLVRELRADDRTRALPIILLSARAGDESTVEGLQSGADDYLVKPFSARELVARVRMQLELAQLRRDAFRQQASAEQLGATLESRDDWLMIVSHELRTPMTALSLNVQTLARSFRPEARATLSDEQANAKIESLERHLSRLREQVETLIDMAELLSNRTLLNTTPTEIGALVARVVQRFGGRAASAGASVSHMQSGPIWASVDPRRLTQIVDALLDNALKFGEGQPIEVHSAQAGNELLLTVVDHGPGVAQADGKRIFSRFERAVPARKFGGFGLGLWGARYLAEAHGGKLEHAETAGGGATFLLNLPISPTSTEGV